MEEEGRERGREPVLIGVMGVIGVIGAMELTDDAVGEGEGRRDALAALALAPGSGRTVSEETATASGKGKSGVLRMDEDVIGTSGVVE